MERPRPVPHRARRAQRVRSVPSSRRRRRSVPTRGVLREAGRALAWVVRGIEGLLVAGGTSQSTPIPETLFVCVRRGGCYQPPWSVQLGFGAGSTCWRRLDEWQQAGVWEELRQVLLDRLRAADQLDFSRATVDASHVQAKRGRSHPEVGPSPTDRGRPGSKHHVLTDTRGTPLRVSLTGGDRHDVTQLLPLVDAVARVRGKPGRPRHAVRRAATAPATEAGRRPRAAVLPLTDTGAQPRVWRRTPGQTPVSPPSRCYSRRHSR